MIEFLTNYKWWLIGAFIASAIGFLSMGMTGAAAMEILNRTVTPLLKGRPYDPEKGSEAMWGIAIAYSLFVPWFAFIVYLGIKQLPLALAGTGIAIPVALITIIALAVFNAYCCDPYDLRAQKQGAWDRVHEYQKAEEMKWRHEAFKYQLEKISFPVKKPICFFGGCIGVNSITGHDADNARYSMKTLLEYMGKPEDYSFTPEQEAHLQQLQADLKALPDVKDWTVEQFQSSPEWNKLRKTAKQFEKTIKP